MAHVKDRWEEEGRRGVGKRWKVAWRTPEGKTRSKSFEKKSDAENFRSRIEIELADDNYTDRSRSRVTLEQLASSWFKSHSTLIEEKTAKSYRSLLDSRILPKWGSYPIGAISYVDVKDWYAELTREGLSASRVRQIHVTLAMILDEAVSDRRLPRNPIRNERQKVRLPKVTKRRRHRYLSHEQVRVLAESIDPRFESVVYTLAYCGLRWSELVALNVENVDPNRRRIQINRSKNHQIREVPIPEFILDLLDERLRLDPETVLFPAPEGGRLYNENFRKSFWLPALRRARLPHMTIHELRHTCASLSIQAGASVLVVARLLGHSPTETLKTYADLFEQDLDDVALRLERGARSAEDASQVVRIDRAPKTALRSI